MYYVLVEVTQIGPGTGWPYFLLRPEILAFFFSSRSSFFQSTPLHRSSGPLVAVGFGLGFVAVGFGPGSAVGHWSFVIGCYKPAHL